MIGLFHTVPSNEYSHCAFTGKVLRFPKMMNQYGYTVVEYANEGSESNAEYKIPILSRGRLEELKGKVENKDFVGDHAIIDSPLHQEFQKYLIFEMKKRVRPGDLILHPFGNSHVKLLDIFKENIHIESGIGYGAYATMEGTHKIFESNAQMHKYYGELGRAGNPSHYWFVVPNYFDLDEWEVESKPGDYIAFLGRIDSVKGLDTIQILADHVDRKIILCGQGDWEQWKHPNIEYKGPIAGKERSNFLKNAYCTLTPTTFVEPFCGVSIESMLCGTPVLSTNYGAFTENIINGFNGFRNNTLQDWIDSYAKIPELDREKIASHTRDKFSLKEVGRQYDLVFQKYAQLYGKGWFTLK